MIRMPRLLPCLALLVSPLFAAQPPASTTWQRLEGYTLNVSYAGAQLRDFVYGRASAHFARGDAARDALTTPAALRARQEQLRRFMIESVGGLPASDTPLNASITGTVRGEGFTIEKVVFEARPRHFVTANLYLPAALTGRTGAVLFLCGHHNTAKQVAEYQVVCQTLVQAGLVVLAQDPIGQGERISYYDPETKRIEVRPGTGEHDHAGAQTRFVGDQIARYFIHDAMRGIDYLISRPEVDAARLGVTGNSGGGTQTSLVMMVDPRIAAAAPATFITSREAYQWTGQGQDAEQNWFGFTAAGFDHEDILLAMAPKPVCVLAVTSDFFPIEGTRRTVARARRAWELFQRGDALALVEDDSTHRFTPTLAQAAAQFFARHLLQREIDPASFPTAPRPEAELQVTQSGQVRGELPRAEFVFEATLGRLQALEAARRKLSPADRRARAVAWLRDEVLRDRVAVELNPRKMERDAALDGLCVDTAFWWTQPRLANLGMLFRPAGGQGRIPVTLALWEDGTKALAKHATWLRAECGRGRAVLVLNLCGVGPLKPDPVNSRAEGAAGVFKKLANDLSFLGDSLVALRTYETLHALDVLAAWPELARDQVRVYAEGRIGLHGKLAAAIDVRIAGCEWKDRFRFVDLVRARDYDSNDIRSILLPGALAYFDLDEI